MSPARRTAPRAPAVADSTRAERRDMRWSATSSRAHRAARSGPRPRPGRRRPPPRWPRPRARRSSSAWPMPSPVIGSAGGGGVADEQHASAPTPAARSMRAGMGHARCGASGAALGPRNVADVGPGEQVGPRAASCRALVRPRRRADAEADVGAAVGQRERPRVARAAGRRSNHTHSSRPARGRRRVKYWRKACHSPQVAVGATDAERLRSGDHMPSAPTT